MQKRTNTADLIGQLLIIGLDGAEISLQLRSLLTRIQPAGVILFARNIVKAEQTWRLLKDCQTCVSTPLFACVDLEGGKVDRFRDVLGPTPSAADVFATSDRKLFRKHGRIVGASCRAMGFNFDLAPVVDLACATSHTVMGSRVVSDDPRKVVTYAREFLAGLREARVFGAVKHFPGLGDASLDTHHALPRVNKSWRKLWEQDLAPYRALRREAAVLVGHAAYPQVTGDCCPASLSRKWVTDVLRKKIRYRGLVLSDDLEMGGVLKAAPIEQAALKFIRAGGNLCLICHSQEHILSCYQALMDEAQSDRKFAQQVQDAASQVLAFKRQSRELRGRERAPSEQKIQGLSRQLWEFGEQVRLKTISSAREPA